MKRPPPLLALLLLLAVRASGAPLAGERGEQPIRLIRADNLRTVEVAGHSFRELDGDVHVRQGGSDLFFEYGRWDQDAGLLYCVTAVRVEEAGRALTCDELVLDEKANTIRAAGSVHATGDSLESWSETAFWREGLEKGELRTRVRMVDHRRQLELDAGEVRVDHAAGVYTAVQGPVLTSLKDPPATLTGRRLQWERASGRAFARGEAVLEREDFVGECDSLAWIEDGRVAEFHGEPVLRREGRRITGDFLLARLDGENRLDSLQVTGSARMESPSDSVDVLLKDVLQGDAMALDFVGGELESVGVDGRARSVIFVKDERGRPGMNVADAKRMAFVLVDRRLKSVAMGGGVSASWLPLTPPPRVPQRIENEEGGDGLEAPADAPEPADAPPGEAPGSEERR